MMASNTRSRKAKGRRLQQKIREDLRSVGKDYGLVPEDTESRQMGGAGVDIILSPAAKKIFPFEIEAKNCESLNVWFEFWDHYRKYETSTQLKMLIHCKNRCEPIVAMRWQDFMKLFNRYLGLKNAQREPRYSKNR